MIHTLIISFGVSSLIEKNDIIMNFLKYFGALYLFYLAFLEFRKNNKLKKNGFENFYLRGFYMNLVNPKVLILFLAYFPNFLFSDTIPISYQFIILGSIFIGQALFIFCFVSLTSNKLSLLLNFDSNGKKIVFFKSFIFILIGLSILI